jgi:putative ATPase
MTDEPTLFDLGDGNEKAPRDDAPLAEQMRPQSLDELVGLEEIAGPESFLTRAIERDRVPSIIFWGPPGSGKTTLARIIAGSTRARFVPFSAVTSGIRDVRAIMEEARRGRTRRGTRTLLFIDEIHRFNRAQQDAFLPYVEAGDVILIGATTENPSFEVNAALLSRCRVIVLPPLRDDAVLTLIERALRHQTIASRQQSFPDETLRYLASVADGDARRGLNALQLVSETTPHGATIDVERAQEILRHRSLRFDKSGEMHFDIISALHKSIRNGDPDAAVYWLARMLEAGEDPLYITRRLVRAAAEDVGLAEPGALGLAISARDAVHFLGMPEAGVVLAELVIHLSLAPKSNSAYLAWGAARRVVNEEGDLPVPLHLRNAPTGLMKDLGYGKDYQYAHDRPEQTTAMRCLPDEIRDIRFYEPRIAGDEKRMADRLEELRRIREQLREEKGS